MNDTIITVTNKEFYYYSVLKSKISVKELYDGLSIKNKSG